MANPYIDCPVDGCSGTMRTADEHRFQSRTEPAEETQEGIPVVCDTCDHKGHVVIDDLRDALGKAVADNNYAAAAEIRDALDHFGYAY